jgi:hypothetical protein
MEAFDFIAYMHQMKRILAKGHCPRLWEIVVESIHDSPQKGVVLVVYRKAMDSRARFQILVNTSGPTGELRLGSGAHTTTVQSIRAMHGVLCSSSEALWRDYA